MDDGLSDLATGLNMQNLTLSFQNEPSQGATLSCLTVTAF
jgi:hypothetical protein